MKFTFKPIFIIIFAAAANWIPLAEANGLPVVTDFTIEAKESRKKEAPILVLFMSKSCTYCEIVLEDFLLPMQRDPEFNKRVILRQIETGSRDKLIDFNGVATTHSAFSSKHQAWGVPTVMLFDSKGNVLSTIVGLLTVDYYYAYLDNAISESQAKIKASTKFFN